MRRYALPLLLFGAVGVVVVILVKTRGDDDAGGVQRDDPEKAAAKPAEKGPTTLLDSGGRNTNTPLKKSRWLSELERVLDRDDLSNAYLYRQKLAEHITEILDDEVLTKNLLDAIRKHAIDSRDPEKRKLLLPLLRVLTTPEATRLIEEEYYRALNDDERLVLLDAMTNPGHNPETASVWAVDMAINSENPTHRHLAFRFFENFDSHRELVISTAKQIYASSTRPLQRQAAIEAITIRSIESKEAQKFVREQLRNPSESEVSYLIDRIEGWATLDDATYLETLATRFPALSMTLRERANKIRTFHNPELAKEMEAAEKERQKERAEREKAEAEREKG